MKITKGLITKPDGTPPALEELRQAATRDAAKALTTLTDTQLVLVPTWGVYRYDPSSTLTPDNKRVLLPDTLPGRLLLDMFLYDDPPPGIPAIKAAMEIPTVQFEAFAGTDTGLGICNAFMPATNLVMDLHALSLRDTHTNGQQVFSWTDGVSGITYTRGGTTAFPKYVLYGAPSNYGDVETEFEWTTDGVRFTETGAALAAAIDRSTNGGVTISVRAATPNAGGNGLFGWYNGPDRPDGQQPYTGLWLGGKRLTPPAPGFVPPQLWLDGVPDASASWNQSPFRTSFFRNHSFVFHDDGTVSLYDDSGVEDTSVLISNLPLPGPLTGGGLSSWLFAPRDWWGRLQGIVVHNEALSLANVQVVHNAFLCRQNNFLTLSSW